MPAASVSTFQYNDIWEGLFRSGARFSADVIARHTPAPATTLYECSACGLQFFVPSIAGDAEFYGQLMASLAYYVPVRYEFGQVDSRLNGAASVLDLGCGQGAFLRAVKFNRPGIRAVGVDSNVAALTGLRSHGIEVYTEDAADFADREPHAFDVVCAFQLLEHVPSPVSLFASAVRLLRPSGRLFISVPNRNRALREPLEPLDCPPHHVTRWSPAQLRQLAENFGLSLASVSLEPPSLSIARAPYWRSAERRLERYGPQAARLMARMNIRLRVPRRWHDWKVSHGVYAQQGIVAHTMLAEFHMAG